MLLYFEHDKQLFIHNLGRLKLRVTGRCSLEKRCQDFQITAHQDAKILDLFIFTDALRVLGGSSAHHQEHITVHTASSIVNQHCC